MHPGNIDDLYSPVLYIYIYISIDRLFHCIKTLLCGSTHKTLQVGIETWLILRQSDMLTQINGHLTLCDRIFKIYNHVRLSVTGGLSLWEELCIYACIAANNYSFDCLTHSEEHIHKTSNNIRFGCRIFTRKIQMIIILVGLKENWLFKKCSYLRLTQHTT